MKVELSVYPGPLAARRVDSVEIIIKIDSTRELPMWYEADVKLPPALSLSQTGMMGTGRFRIGICEPRGSLSKGIKVFSNHNTPPQLYKCDVALFAYDGEANQKDRSDMYVQLRCENK
ncbi:hypothetical protein H0O01_03010 [Candidatus Micrarchaeota archaeon]|nr:hypothetical protein [Candidatus Micrarchaeota archaeon]